MSKEGFAPDRKKIEKIQEWPFPTTGLEMLSYLGLCKYYTKLIPAFVEHAFYLYQVAQQK